MMLLQELQGRPVRGTREHAGNLSDQLVESYEWRIRVSIGEMLVG